MPPRRSARKRVRKTIRMVHFYRLHDGPDGDGGFRGYDIGAALARIGQLPFQEGGRYVTDGDDTVLGLWPDGLHGAHHRLRFATIRRAALPLIEEAGQLSDLVIPANAGIAEITHFAVFENGITGVLYNNYGPRPPKLTAYLSELCPQPLDQPQISALLRPDVAAQIARLEDIRMLDLAVQHGREGLLAEHDEGLAQVLRAASVLTDAQRVRLVLQPEPYARGGLGRSTRSLIQRLARIVGIGSILDRCVVKGYDPQQGAQVDLDLLKEHLVSRQDVVFLDNRSRALNDDSAYAAIQNAHAELHDQLRRAATAWVDIGDAEA